MEVEITRKRKKGRPRKLREECIKKDLEQYDLKGEDAYGMHDNGIKTDVVLFFTSSDDSDFWRKCSFGSKKLVLSKNHK